MVKKHIAIFITGFAQVLLVSANIYFISKTSWPGIAICGFGISFLWSINVKKVSLGNRTEQVVYSTGAMMGGLAGVLLARLIK
jgi:hypothetical protein